MRKTLIATLMACIPCATYAVTVKDVHSPIDNLENVNIHWGIGDALRSCSDVRLAQELASISGITSPKIEGYVSFTNYVWLDRLCQNQVVPRISNINLGPSFKGARVALVANPTCFGPSKNTVAVIDGAGHELLHVLALRIAPLPTSRGKVADIVVEGMDKGYFFYRWNAAAHQFDDFMRIQSPYRHCYDLGAYEEELPHPQCFYDTVDPLPLEERTARKMKKIRHWIDETSGKPATCEDARLLKALGLAEAVWVENYTKSRVAISVLNVDLGAPLPGARALIFSGPQVFGPDGVRIYVVDGKNNFLLKERQNVTRLPSKKDGVNDLMINSSPVFVYHWDDARHFYAPYTGISPS